MSEIKFSVYKAPSKSEQTTCARFVSRGTQRMENICEYISDCCTLTSSDIKAVLDALSNYMGTQLSYGYSVQLDGIGIFSPALKTVKKEAEEEGKETYTVAASSVNFRCSNTLKKKLKRSKAMKIKRENTGTSTSPDERKAQLLTYLAAHSVINITDYALLNRCTQYIARKEIHKLIEEGCLESQGYKTHRVYKRVEKEEE